MKRYTRLTTSVMALLSAGIIYAPVQAQDDLDARARVIHQRILAIDSHVDVLLPDTPAQYFTADHSSRADLDRLRRGGIGAAAFAIAVGPGPRTADGVAKAREEADAKLTLSDYVDHIDYIVKCIGVDHVGIGSDFNHGAGIEGFDDESEAPNVTRELLRRGYTEEQIAKIWGGNFLRVFREVESVARRLQTS